MVGQLLQALSIKNITRGVRAWENHDESIGLGEEGVEVVFAVDFNSVADTLSARDAPNFGAEADELRGEGLCNETAPGPSILVDRGPGAG